jgi:hypothetical protein
MQQWGRVGGRGARPQPKLQQAKPINKPQYHKETWIQHFKKRWEFYVGVLITIGVLIFFMVL